MNESEVAARCDELLTDAGWFVFKTSQDKSTRRQLAGLPDRLCFRHGVTLLIEYKAPGGELRDSQIKFAASVRPHCGPNLQYLVIHHPLQLPRWMMARL